MGRTIRYCVFAAATVFVQLSAVEAFQFPKVFGGGLPRIGLDNVS